MTDATDEYDNPPMRFTVAQIQARTWVPAGLVRALVASAAVTRLEADCIADLQEQARDQSLTPVLTERWRVDDEGPALDKPGHVVWRTTGYVIKNSDVNRAARKAPNERRPVHRRSGPGPAVGMVDGP